MMTPIDILRAARDTIADPEHWTQGQHAIDNTGLEVDPFDVKACAWCADGAMLKATGYPGRLASQHPAYREAAALLRSATWNMYPETGLDTGILSYTAVNDGEVGIEQAAHENILAVFDAAMRARGRG